MRTALFVVLVTCSLLGQSAVKSSDGKLRGTVLDTQKAAISNATLLIRSKRLPENSISVKSDQRGNFEANLPAGYYDVFVTATGFAPTCAEIEVKTTRVAIYKPMLKQSQIDTTD